MAKTECEHAGTAQSGVGQRFLDHYLWLFDFPALHIVTLVLCVAHGEGFPGQHAVGNDSFEELVLAPWQAA